MRADISLPLSEREFSAVQTNITEDLPALRKGMSFSGQERNHLFLSQNGEQFKDISGISGLDHPTDGRRFAIWDYDRDGWLDVAVVNANEPRLQILRNQLGESERATRKNRVVGFRFVGGNRSDEPSSFSNRNGYGATLTARLDANLTITREHRCGEGFGAQNSSTVVIGIGARDGIESLKIQWPSGAVQETRYVPAGSLITIYEDPGQAPDGQPFVASPYAVLPERRQVAQQDNRPTLDHLPTASASQRLQLITTTATWCMACKQALPQLRRLRNEFSPTAMAMLAVPADAKENRDALLEYAAEYNTPYEILVDLSPAQIESHKELIDRALHSDATPCTVLADKDGNVLHTMLGVPSVSDVRRLLRTLPRQDQSTTSTNQASNSVRLSSE